MTEVVFIKNADHRFLGFECNGHAGYRKFGKDIVCASISALTINTINSIEKLVGCSMNVEEDSKKGFLKLELDEPDERTDLLLASLQLGLEEIEDSYGSKYCKVTIKERKQC